MSSTTKAPKPEPTGRNAPPQFPPRPVKDRRPAEAMLEDIKRDFPKTLAELAK